MSQDSALWDSGDSYLEGSEADDAPQRPNRWQGHPTTWLNFTEDERSLNNSLERLRDQNLSVHLYNSFFLEKKYDRLKEQGCVAGHDDGQPNNKTVDKEKWRSWTAWPMRCDLIPKANFLRQQEVDDPDDIVEEKDEVFGGDEHGLEGHRTGSDEEGGSFDDKQVKEEEDSDGSSSESSGVYVTKGPSGNARSAMRDVGTIYSKAASLTPYSSQVLKEELTASILRIANQRFQEREPSTYAYDAIPDEEDEGLNPTIESDTAMSPTQETIGHIVPKAKIKRSRSRSQPIYSSQAGIPTLNQALGQGTRSSSPEELSFRPVPTSDDTLSTSILRPFVTHTLSNLDKTLTVLHNARFTTLGYQSDTSDDSNDEGHAEARKAGIIRSAAPVISPKKRKTSDNSYYGEKRLRLSPEKRNSPQPQLPTLLPIRVSSQDRRTFKVRPTIDSQDEEERAAHGPTTTADEIEMEGMAEKNRAEIRRRQRYGLRDWADVIGAASISGFPPEVIARAAHRCANLFGQSMEINTLLEGPASTGNVAKTRIEPNTGDTMTGGGTDAFMAHQTHEQLARMAFLRTNQNVGGDPIESRKASRVRQHQGSRSRSRSRSASTSTSLMYCSYPSCKRAIEGFSRRANLQRHLQTVHGASSQPGSVASSAPSSPTPTTPGAASEDSEDEMDGGVHVDGFLRPIRVRRGWREAESSGRPWQKGRRSRSRKSREPSADASDVDVEYG